MNNLTVDLIFFFHCDKSQPDRSDMEWKIALQTPQFFTKFVHIPNEGETVELEDGVRFKVTTKFHRPGHSFELHNRCDVYAMVGVADLVSAKDKAEEIKEKLTQIFTFEETSQPVSAG